MKSAARLRDFFDLTVALSDAVGCGFGSDGTFKASSALVIAADSFPISGFVVAFLSADFDFLPFFKVSSIAPDDSAHRQITFSQTNPLHIPLRFLSPILQMLRQLLLATAT
jgi:hypothetical protein